MTRTRSSTWSAAIMAMALVAVTSATPAARTARAATAPLVAEQPKRSNPLLGKLPIAFEANAGQYDPSVLFVARDKQGTVFLTSRDVVVAFGGGGTPRTAVRLAPAGGASAPVVEGLDPVPGVSNSFIGNDPSRWRTNVRRYARVRYRNVYPGVDLVYHGGAHGVEYDFVLSPGTDPRRIALDVSGADSVSVDETGALVATTCAGELRQDVPHIYQELDGLQRDVAGGFSIHSDNRVGFDIGAYDVHRPLVVDPTIRFALRFGGSGNDSVLGIAVDSDGGVYITGFTASADFPTVSPLDPTLSGFQDSYVAKVNSDGTGLEWATYLGGSGDPEQSYGIAVDSDKNVYVVGATNANDFPVTSGAVQPTYGGSQDAFLTKLNANGNALVYSTYLGGSLPEIGAAIAVDSGNRAYVAGTTYSSNYPTHNGFDTTGPTGGRGDAFLTVLNAAGSALDYSTFLGGPEHDGGQAIAIGQDGSAYVSGFAGATFPTTPGALSGTFGGGGDGFAAKFDPSLSGASSLEYSTYLGGNQFENTSGIAVDSAGNAYVTGSTGSTNLPVTANAFQASYNGGTSDAFVQELSANGSTLVYGSYLGGSADDAALGIARGAGGVLVVGYTGSPNFPQAGAVQSGYGGGAADAFVTNLSTGGGAPDFSSYIGGSDFESGNAIALSADGSGAYVGIQSSSSDFPSNAIKGSRPNRGGGSDNAVLLAIILGSPVPRPDLVAENLSYSVTVGRGSVDDIRVGVYCFIANLGTVKADAVDIYVDLQECLLFDSVKRKPSDSSTVISPNVGSPGRVSFMNVGSLGPLDRAIAVVDAHFDTSTPDCVRRFMITASISAQTSTLERDLSNNSRQRQITIQTLLPKKTIAFLTPATIGAPPSDVSLLAGQGSGRAPMARRSAPLAIGKSRDALGYRVYTASTPNVQAIPANLLAELPPDVTFLDVGTVPDGNYFVVTALYDSGESGVSNEVGGPLPTITKVTVTGSKIVANGSGFATGVGVTFGGLPFESAPKLKKNNTKVVQKGLTTTGLSIGEVLGFLQAGDTVLVTFKNPNGNGVAIEYTK